MTDLDFDTFLQWEVEARRAAGSAVPSVTIAAARGEWLSKRRKDQYIAALELLQASIENSEDCNENIYDLPASVPSDLQTALAGLRRREGTLEAMTESCRAVYENLQRLQQEQTERDDSGEVIANKWTTWYTENLIMGTLESTRQAQDQVQLCRMARIERGSEAGDVEPLFPGSEGVQTVFGMDGTEDSEWIFVEELGEGAGGQVSLWCRRDNSGNVVEKIAAKDSNWPPRNNIAFYKNGSGDKQLREPYMHALLSAQDSTGSHTVIYRGERMFETKHRMYLEFCPHGDLWSVMARLNARRNSMNLSKPAVPAMWALFESLVKAQWLMSYGVFPGTSQVDGWSTMLHRDIKPENVMLSTPAEDEWAGLPTMKLGDFGFAGLHTEPSFQTTSCGTAMYCAPEVACAGWSGLPEGVSISTPADIWSIGATMTELMNAGDRHQASIPCRFDIPKSEPPKIGSSARAFYPSRLVQLVERCLQRLPARRIGLPELRIRISFEANRLSRRELSDDDRMRFPLEDESNRIVRLNL